MVVEVSLHRVDPDGLLRHPVFQGVREDKPASDVRREEAKVSQARSAGKRTKRDAPPRRHRGRCDDHPSRPRGLPGSGHHQAGTGAVLRAGRIAACCRTSPAGHCRWCAAPKAAPSNAFSRNTGPGTPPPSIDTVAIRQSDGKRHPHVVIHDVEGLVTLVQWGVMEIHPWGSRADDPERPDRIIFDLDPGPGVTWGSMQDAAGGAARRCSTALASTAGSRPVAARDFMSSCRSRDAAAGTMSSAFARAVAEQMQLEFPDRFISKASKSARKGLIFVDWLRNTRGATAVAPWSTRARSAPASRYRSRGLNWRRLTAGDQFTLLSIRAKPAAAASTHGRRCWPPGRG